jgi:hypothetical protein
MGSPVSKDTGERPQPATSALSRACRPFGRPASGCAPLRGAGVWLASRCAAPQKREFGKQSYHCCFHAQYAAAESHGHKPESLKAREFLVDEASLLLLRQSWVRPAPAQDRLPARIQFMPPQQQ